MVVFSEHVRKIQLMELRELNLSPDLRNPIFVPSHSPCYEKIM